MVLAVNGVANVMQIPGYVSQLRNPRIVAKMFQHILGNIADQPRVPLPMFRVAQCFHRSIRRLQKGDDLGIAAQIFNRDELVAVDGDAVAGQARRTYIL